MSFRPRFSLLSLLLIAALVCVSIAHWRLHQENSAIHQERDKLRDELGHLVVYDPEKAYVREAYSEPPLAWKYRIYLPEGEYWICTTSGDLKKPYYSRPGVFSQCESGEFQVDVSLRKMNDMWMLNVHAGNSGFGGSIDQEAGDWLSDGRSTDWQPFPRQQKERPPNQPIMVLSHIRRVNGTRRGVIVYIDPVDPQVRVAKSLKVTTAADVK